MTLSLLGFISRSYFITVPIQPNQTLFVGILTLQSMPNDWSLSLSFAQSTSTMGKDNAGMVFCPGTMTCHQCDCSPCQQR